MKASKPYNTFQTSAFKISTHVTLAKASNMAEPQAKGQDIHSFPMST